MYTPVNDVTPPNDVPIIGERYGLYDDEIPIVKVWYSDGLVRLFRIEGNGLRVLMSNASHAAHAWASCERIDEDMALKLGNERAAEKSRFPSDAS